MPFKTKVLIDSFLSSDKQINHKLDIDTNTLELQIPRNQNFGSVVNNQKESHSFRFSKVFTTSAKQSDVFEVVARPVIENCLKGYNGTVFVYG